MSYTNKPSTRLLWTNPEQIILCFTLCFTLRWVSAVKSEQRRATGIVLAVEDRPGSSPMFHRYRRTITLLLHLGPLARSFGLNRIIAFGRPSSLRLCTEHHVVRTPSLPVSARERHDEYGALRLLHSGRNSVGIGTMGRTTRSSSAKASVPAAAKDEPTEAAVPKPVKAKKTEAKKKAPAPKKTKKTKEATTAASSSSGAPAATTGSISVTIEACKQ
jgi:hypothetical protein